MKKGVSRKQNANFSENQTFLTLYRNVRFFGKFDVLYFLETPAFRFALLPYYRRIFKSNFAMPKNILWLCNVCKGIIKKRIGGVKKTWN